MQCCDLSAEVTGCVLCENRQCPLAEDLTGRGYVKDAAEPTEESEDDEETLI